MANDKRHLSRRMVLRGAGGIAVAIPFMPSLAPRSHAGGSLTAPRRFVNIVNGHGGVWGQYMYPGDETLTETDSYVGHTIRRGDVTPTVEGADRVISPVLSADSTKLTAPLADQISILRGLDIPFYISHHWGGCGGNYHATTHSEIQGNLTPRATIDQLMAYSDSFYGGPANILTRSLVMYQSNFYNWADPLAQSGEVTQVPAVNDNMQLFDQVFVAMPPEQPVDPRPLVVDRVLEQYQSLRQSNRRLSGADRMRLDEHLAKLDELERRLTTVVSCGDQQPPSESSSELRNTPGFLNDTALQRDYWRLMADIAVVAFLCDSSRVVSIGIDGPFFTEGLTYADWHQEVAHTARAQALTPEQMAAGVTELGQERLWPSVQQLFENVFVELIAKLDVEDPFGGGTILDNSLVLWQQESGRFTHDSQSIPAITAGSAGGTWRTGQYIDYRDRSTSVTPGYVDGTQPDHPPPEERDVYTGLYHAQFLGTVLQAMGMPRKEWEVATGGYGDPYTEGDPVLYGPREAARSEPLPWIYTG